MILWCLVLLIVLWMWWSGMNATGECWMHSLWKPAESSHCWLPFTMLPLSYTIYFLIACLFDCVHLCYLSMPVCFKVVGWWRSLFKCHHSYIKDSSMNRNVYTVIPYYMSLTCSRACSKHEKLVSSTNFPHKN